jgi:hypothetical protein
VIGVCVTLLVAAVAVPAAYLIRGRLAEQHFKDAVAAFATAWRSGTLETVAYQGAAGPEVAKQAAAITAGLTPAAKDNPAAVDVVSTHGPSDGAGSVALRVRWALGQGRSWQYDTAANLRDSDGAWRVEWSPAVVHPKLTAGQVFTTSRTPATRGEILGADKETLVTQRQVVNVGIQPGRAKDRRAAAAAVAALVDVDAADLTKRVLAASPTAFVDVITLREEDYQPLKSRLQPIPGTVFQRTTRSLGPSAGFARALLGTTGPATKEIVDASKGRVTATDVTGLSGLQRRYDAQLAGTAGLTVQAGPPPGAASGAAASGAAASGTAGNAAGAAAPAVLFTVPPVNGTDLRLTLDVAVQQAAEAALAKSGKPWWRSGRARARYWRSPTGRPPPRGTTAP